MVAAMLRIGHRRSFVMVLGDAAAILASEAFFQKDMVSFWLQHGVEGYATKPP